MRRLIVSEFITLDGVIEAPGFEEHRTGRNAWALRFQNEDTQQFKMEEAFAAGALLLGRTTYQIFALFWPTAEENEFSVRMNQLPKYVVSRTLTSADWSNTTILRGDLQARVTALKEQPGGDILVYGSADLVADLVKHDLVDEFRFMLFPVILGSGKRLFRDEVELKPMHLVNSRSFSSGTARRWIGNTDSCRRPSAALYRECINRIFADQQRLLSCPGYPFAQGQVFHRG